MGDNSLRNMLYCFARLGLFFLINIFSVIITRLMIVGIVGSLLPKLQLQYRPAMQSGIAFVIAVLFLIALFKDDAKRHTAYYRYNPTLVSILMILTAGAYYIPAMTIEYIDSKAGTYTIDNLYFGFEWLKFIDRDIQVYGLIGVILLAAISIGTYILSRKVYLKKFESGEYEYEVEI